VDFTSVISDYTRRITREVCSGNGWDWRGSCLEESISDPTAGVINDYVRQIASRVETRQI